MKTILTALFFLSLVTTDASADSASLKGGVSSQKRQNRKADAHDLTRIKDRTQLKAFIEADRLVHIKGNDAYVLSDAVGSQDPDHVGLYRHARPWVKLFLDDVLSEGHDATGEVFVVTSLVRTKVYQKKLVKKGGTAIGGKRWWQQSSHTTGSTVDISYKDMSTDARKWLEKRLLALEKAGKIEALKEYGSACYHIMVFPEYGKSRK